MDMTAEWDEGPAPSRFSRWLVPALILSLLLHGLFWYWASGVTVNRFANSTYQKIVPPTFRITQAHIDPKLLEPEPSKDKHAAMAPEPLKLPEDKVSFDKLMADTPGTPSAPKLDPILSEKPTATQTSLNNMVQTAELSGATSVLEDSKAMREEILNDKPQVGKQNFSDIVAPEALSGRAIAKNGELHGGAKPGFSNLDDLLAQTGPLSAETAPILMPTDLLFDYDQTALRPQAMSSLEKLGALIQRNPQATFTIEGHSDSFGSDEYNLALSQHRADSVKAWLVTTMKIPESRITTQGFGKTRLIAPASGSIDEQQINRRVEIVIHTK